MATIENDTRCQAGTIVMGFNWVDILVKARVVKLVGDASYELIVNGNKYTEVSRANKWYKYDEKVFNEIKNLERSEHEIRLRKSHVWNNYLFLLNKEVLNG
ncbi:MAG: hypothetical protein ABW041_00280 [Dehalococcoides mccartyi]|nr:hypothetical protein DMOBY_05940 [Dehalococcoides mccartyi]